MFEEVPGVCPDVLWVFEMLLDVGFRDVTD